MHRRSSSQAIYRALLCMYPHEFRARFASDLEADFADLLQARGTMATWLRAAVSWTDRVTTTRPRKCRMSLGIAARSITRGRCN
jgi:hypothetical protein